MKHWRLAALFGLGLTLGCMAGSVSMSGDSTSVAPMTPPRASGAVAPLIIDRADLRIGTTVTFNRIPSITEIHDLHQLPSLVHVVVDLATWPESYADIEPLAGIPDESDMIVVLRGYPPTRATGEIWNYLTGRIRMVVLVPGPPPSRPRSDELNAMRYLERVIAQMDEPSRSGFEGLQRPLSFLKVVN